MGQEQANPEESPAIRPGASARTAGVLALLFAIAAGAWLTWRRTAHVYIDFGYELYLPWQLAEGRALYRDLAYRNGPLSPFVNSTLFRSFGVSLSVLLWFNLAVLTAFTFGTARIFRHAASHRTGVLVALAFVALFAFGQYLPTENFNWMTPYQHGQTHGAALTLALLLAWMRHLREARATWSLLAGVALGLVFLTKAELFVPAAAVSLAALWIAWRTPDRTAPLLGVTALPHVVGMLLPLIVFALWLGSQLGFPAALDGVLGNWGYVGSAVAEDAFYLEGSGFNDVASNLRTTLLGAGILLALLGAIQTLARLGPALLRDRAGSTIAGVAVAGALFGAGRLVPWSLAFRGLPVFCLAGAGWWTVSAVRSQGRWQRVAPLLLWSVWSFALLAKMLLNARIYHYGFVLAAPATLLLVYTLVHGLPSSVGQAQRGLARALGLGVVVGLCAFHAHLSLDRYSGKIQRIGAGSDHLLRRPVEPDSASPQPAVLIADGIQSALDALERDLPEAKTLLVLPEGAGINYWARRPNPSRYSLFLPTEFDAVGGADVMLADIQSNPPDCIMCVPRDFREFRVGSFGETERSGRVIAQWVFSNYTPIAPPDRSGVLLMRPNDPLSPR